MKTKQCGVCLKDFPSLWKAKRKLPDGTIEPAMCKDCANRSKPSISFGDTVKIGFLDANGKPVTITEVPNTWLKPLTSDFKPLQSTKTIKTIPRQSSKEKKRQAAYSVLRKEFMKQYPKCMFKDCQRLSEECHHVRGRTGEYLLDTTEWMAVCSIHHKYIHHNDAECRELGYLKSRLGK